LRDNAIIRLLDSGPVWYLPGASDGARSLGDEQAISALQQFTSERRTPPIVALPGSEVVLHTIGVSPAERKHLDKSLPFRLEEELAEDVTSLHFSHCPLNDTQQAVALTRRQNMTLWQQQLAALPAARQWIAEPLLLPWQPGEWTLLLEQDKALVRTGACRGFVVEKALLPVFLASAVDEVSDSAVDPSQASSHSTLPHAVIVYSQDHEGEQSLLPSVLLQRAQWRNGDFSTAMLLADANDSLPNLLQGDYAPRLPLLAWWRQWRAVAALLLLAIVLQLAATFSDFRALSVQNQALLAQIENRFRHVFPSGVMQDAEIQLRRKLESLRGGPSSTGFTSLLYVVGKAIALQPGARVSSINYNERLGDMRLNLVADDFESIESIRQAMISVGLDAVMESSNARSGGVQARLRIRLASQA